MLDRLFSQPVLFFTLPALIGTLVFLIKLGLMTLGGLGGEVGFDADIDADVDADFGTDVDSGDSTAAFKLLSVQAIAAFLMGFGWGGLGGAVGLDWTFVGSAALGVGFGAAMMWLLGLMLKAMHDLQSSGNITLRDAIGLEGAVYSAIPARNSGRGQVRVVVHGRSRIFNAVSTDVAIASKANVRIVGANNDNTLTVAPA